MNHLSTCLLMAVKTGEGIQTFAFQISQSCAALHRLKSRCSIEEQHPECKAQASRPHCYPYQCKEVVSTLVAALAINHLLVAPLLDAQHAEPCRPEHGREDHTSSRNPADDEEVLATRGMNVCLLGDFVQLRDALRSDDSDDHGADGQGEGAEAGQDEVDEDKEAG